MELCRRLARIAAVAGAALVFGAGATACSSGPLATTSAAEVGGRSISRQDVFDQVAMDEQFARVQAELLESRIADDPNPDPGLVDELRELNAGLESTGTETLPRSKVTQALTMLVQIQMVDMVLERVGGEVTETDRTDAQKSLESQLGQAGLGSKDLPAGWVEQQVEFSAVQRAIQRELEVSDAELQAAFEEQAGNYAQVCVSLIQVADEADAEAARARVLAGEPFADVATEVSEDQVTAAQGGVAGCASAAEIIPSLGDEIVEAEVDVPLDPHEVNGTWVVSQVTSRTVPEIDAVAQELQSEILQQKLSDHFEATATSVTIDPRFGTWDASEYRVVPSGRSAE